MFSAEIPKFTLEGKPYVSTLSGGLLSFFVFYITFLFSIMKLKQLVERRNPTVNTYVDSDALTMDDRFDMSAENFMVAVALEGFYSGLKSDPRYIRWMAEIHTSQDDQYYKKLIPLHECTERDYEKFLQPDARSKKKVDKLRKNGGLMCLDF